MARGKYAWAIDDISGFKVPYRKLKTQWNGLRVAEPDFDIKHPQLEPRHIKADAQSLRDARPDTDTGATSYPTWSSYSPTTQLHEILSMTFGAVT